MAQQLRMLAALPEDQSVATSSHDRKLKTAYNSSSKGFHTLFQPPRSPEHMLQHWHTETKN